MPINLYDWINTGRNIEAYQNWRNDPVTRILLDGLRVLATRRRLPTPTGEAALEELGFLCGRDSSCFILENLDSFIRSEEPDQDDYSRVRYLVEAEHYTALEAKRIVAEARERG